MREFVEKYSTYIGIGLIIISLVGGVLLMVKRGASANVAKSDDRDKQITELKSQVAALEKENQSLKTQPVVQATSSTQTTNVSQSTTSSQPAGKININTATAAQLDSLPGIGATYSQRIVDFRNTNGPFSSIDKIQDVKGIGPKTFEKFKDLITI